MAYKVFERTRGFRDDYRWVGEPPEEWWRGHPAAGVVVNQNGLLRVGNKWLLTGIPTGRQDSIGTPITSDYAIVPDADGEMSAGELQSLLNQHFPNWENSSNTLVTPEFTVHSPLLTPEVKAHLAPQPPGVSAPSALSQRNLTQAGQGERGAAVTKAGAAGKTGVAVVAQLAWYAWHLCQR